MKIKSLLTLSLLFVGSALASGNLLYNDDKGEVTFIKNRKRLPDRQYQAELRQLPAWQNFLNAHGTWYASFNEENQKPHRAFGKPIPTVGIDAESRALYFINQYLGDFNVPVSELTLQAVNQTPKHYNVIFNQEHQGSKVLWSRMYVKMTLNGDVVMWGTDVHDDLSSVSVIPALSPANAIASAQQNLPDAVTSTSIEMGTSILPIPGDKEYKYRLVYEVEVKTMSETKIPGIYRTYVDADNGEVLYRQNMVQHFCEHDHGHDHDGHKCSPSAPTPPPIALTLQGTVVENFLAPSVVKAVPNAEIDIAGTVYHTDGNGMVTLPDNNPVSATMTLRGLYSYVYSGTNGTVSPSYTTTLNPGAVTESWDGNALDTEVSAYVGVNEVHEVMKLYTDAGFTTLDSPMLTRVDRTDGECNAFYNGSSINFYAAGSNGTSTCPATAYFNDVVYHEYGHGINNDYYQYWSGFFGNGALNEGYADIWAMAVSNNPVLGAGFQTDATTYVRRYDIDPKVYPQDLVGEVHADGEIICGAWWDLGQDIGVTNMMDIFINTYPAVLSEAAGNEGQLYTDVLIEALMYDDNDGDITNGTPNGNAIVFHFDAHGITLVSNAVVQHTDLQLEAPNVPITIDATLQLTFPYTTYLSALTCYYKVNGNPTLNSAPMSNTSGNNFTVDLPSQPFGTLISYYIGAEDIFGNASGVIPFAADEAMEPNVPYFILVGYSPFLTEDLDFNSDFGNWEVGSPSDNATTGEWEINIPLGSFGDVNDPSTMVAPDYQHTPGGELCFLTGKANTVNDAIGTNDVDGGTTTLTSPVIDLTGYTNPTFSYWRYYINNPASGANPFADWWQVRVSDDGGATWHYVEDTKRSDPSYRRFAFRVQDHVNITSQFMMKFNVSDSIRAGQNLDGGSLIEATLDDIVLWDNADPNSVEENYSVLEYGLYPNPTNDQTNASFVLPEATNVRVVVINTVGEEVINDNLGYMAIGPQQAIIDTRNLAEGVYMVTLQAGDQQFVRRLTVVK